MALHIYNTLTRRKELFQPLNPPKVGMYVCGVTVYDYCHLGHARALINFDVIYRYLTTKGFEVTYVRNYTDVDDKIIKRAEEEGIAWNELAEKYIRAFNEDMEALKLEKPTCQPKATEHIGEILKIVEALVEKGCAYKAGADPAWGADIFYSVRKKSDYGKLSGKKIDELESGARVEIHEAKNDPLDFALWKASKPGEPLWKSPWGDGRPGWHIECSAMSIKYLGVSFDIHGGGRDLAFPHHENEIAQSEAYSGKPFARYWIHNGFVNINAEKMSKSLGNFLTIRDLLKEYHEEVIRLFILSAHYRSPLDYTEKNMQSARQSLNRWYVTMARIRGHCGKEKKAKLKPDEAKLAERVSRLYADFEEAMDDDFNTARVNGLLFDLMREWNKALDSEKTVCSSICHLFVDTVARMSEVLGVFGSDPETYLAFERGQVLKKADLAPEEIERKIQARNEARKNRKWEEADEIRKELTEAGVQLKDNPDGTTTWSVG